MCAARFNDHLYGRGCPGVSRGCVSRGGAQGVYVQGVCWGRCVQGGVHPQTQRQTPQTHTPPDPEADPPDPEADSPYPSVNKMTDGQV